MYSGSSGNAALNDIAWYNWGIAAIWGASPNSYWSQVSNLQMNNRITNCLLGLNVYMNSYCNFGVAADMNYSYNSIYNNSSYNAAVGYSYPSNGSGLWAQKDWWSGQSKFYVSPACYLYHDQPLPGDPWGDFPPPAGSLILAGSVANTDNGTSFTDARATEVQSPANTASVQDSLLIGVGLLEQNRHSEARDYFIAYLKQHPDNQAGYVTLYGCADSSTIPSLIQFFKSLPNKAAKEHGLLLSNLFLMNGDVNSAKQVNDSIIAANPNTPLGTRAKLGNFYIALYEENNRVAAAAILKDVESNVSLSTPTEVSDAEHALSIYWNADSEAVGSAGGALSAGTQFLREAKEESATSVQEDFPKEFRLSQNYPNPFNPTTVMSYDIPKDGKVTLKIYDALGREVETLVNDHRAAGRYSITFDASGLPSGVYFYRLVAGNFLSTKKMLLVPLQFND